MISTIMSASIPLMIFFIVAISFKEKKKTFENFLEGAKSGIYILLEIFPTLIGLFVAINMLRVSGVLSFIVKLFMPIFALIGIPAEILPMAILRPISGSSTVAVATELMKQYGVDTYIGLIISTIMGSTETTIYTVSVYTRGKNYKNIWKVITVALLGDLLGIILSVKLCQIML